MLASRRGTMLITDNRVFISSTARGLEDFRQTVIRAVNGMDGFAALAMEDFGARSESPEAFCRRVVGGCNVLVCIVGHQFGSAPEPGSRSFTQLEYDAAEKLDIPRLVFLASEDFPVPANQRESDELCSRQRRFRQELGESLMLATFRDTNELARKVVTALSNSVFARKRPDGAQTRGRLPVSPAPNVVHPYPIQTGFTGRALERGALTHWLTQEHATIFVLVAIGGMGKSAVAWTWLQEDVLGKEFPGNVPLAETERERCRVPAAERPAGGVFWWSFYEHEATFEAFVAEALRYLGAPATGAGAAERVRTLGQLLAETPVLFVLDGVERILNAYAKLAAAYQGDVFDAIDGRAERRCADPNAATFLRSASQHRARIVMTTRLMPFELDNRAGVMRMDLSALPETDAIRFYRERGIVGTELEIRTVCERYGRHPLALALLAGLIREDPVRPGDIVAARAYDPVPELVQREHHVLEIAFARLNDELRRVLTTIAAFRFPMSFEVAERIVNADAFAPELQEVCEQRRPLLNAYFAYWGRFVVPLNRHQLSLVNAFKRLLVDLRKAPNPIQLRTAASTALQLTRLGEHQLTMSPASEGQARHLLRHCHDLEAFLASDDPYVGADRRTGGVHLYVGERRAWLEAIEASVQTVTAGGWRSAVELSLRECGQTSRHSVRPNIDAVMKTLQRLEKDPDLHRIVSTNACVVAKHELLRIAAEIEQRDATVARALASAGDRFRRALSELTSRGFLMFDRESRNFDLHPVVRQYAYDHLNQRDLVHAQMRDYFSTLPQQKKVQGLNDLTATIELYHHTLQAGQRLAAAKLFSARLMSPLFYGLGAYQVCIELLEALMSTREGLRPLFAEAGSAARREDGAGIGDVASILCHAYSLTGHSRKAKEVSEQMLDIGKSQVLGARLGSAFQVALADDLIKLGALAEASRLLELPKGPWNQPDWEISQDNLRERRRIAAYAGATRWGPSAQGGDEASSPQHNETRMGRVYTALGHFLAGTFRPALDELDLAEKRALSRDGADSKIWSGWLRAACLVALDDHAAAEGHLHTALTSCRKTGLVELEASILCTRARWLWRTGKPGGLEALAEARAIAERCEYRLQQADIHVLEAEIHRAAGDRERARNAAGIALERATCDGPPFSYAAGVRAAQRVLAELDASSDGGEA